MIYAPTRLISLLTPEQQKLSKDESRVRLFKRVMKTTHLAYKGWQKEVVQCVNRQILMPDDHRPKVAYIVGKTHTGKTAFVERLLG